jgi:hypothetical protein
VEEKIDINKEQLEFILEKSIKNQNSNFEDSKYDSDV